MAQKSHKWLSPAQPKTRSPRSYKGDSPLSPAVQGCSKIQQFFQNPTPEVFSFLLVFRHSRVQSSPCISNNITHRNCWHFPISCPQFLQTKKSESPKVVVSSQKKKVSSSHRPIEPCSQLFKQSPDRFILVKSTLWPWTSLGQGEPARAKVGGR